jgi:hypothetical protein
MDEDEDLLLAELREDAPVEILPRLFLGNHYHATDFEAQHPEALVYSMGYMVGDGHAYQRWPERWRFFDVCDSLQQDLLSLFDDLTEDIHANLQEGKPIYVHCHLGKSRAPTVVAAYLIRYRGFDHQGAIRFIRDKRPEALPNFAFMQQLRRYHAIVRERQS